MLLVSACSSPPDDLEAGRAHASEAVPRILAAGDTLPSIATLAATSASDIRLALNYGQSSPFALVRFTLKAFFETSALYQFYAHEHCPSSGQSSEGTLFTSNTLGGGETGIGGNLIHSWTSVPTVTVRRRLPSTGELSDHSNCAILKTPIFSTLTLDPPNAGHRGGGPSDRHRDAKYRRPRGIDGAHPHRR